MVSYRDVIILPGECHIETLQIIEDKCREHGTVVQSRRSAAGRGHLIEFEVEANTLWDLAEIVFEIRDHCQSYGVDFLPRREALMQEAS